MKKILVLLFVSLCLTFQAKPLVGQEVKDSFTVSGQIIGDYDGMVYFNYLGFKDSVKLKGNTFRFEGALRNPTRGWINLTPPSNVAWVYLENSDITINSTFEKKMDKGELVNFLELTDVKGSHSEDLQRSVTAFFKAHEKKDNFQALLFQQLDSLIEINPSHPLFGSILGELALLNPVLSVPELESLYSKLDTSAIIPTDIFMYEKGIKNLSKFSKGKPFVHFNLPNIQDKHVDINQYKGKATLVTFWASWCGPCREKHPELKELKEKLADLNFDIVGISIDRDKDSWLKAVEADGLTWTNLLDHEKAVKKEVGIMGVPMTYLIDGNGVIIEVNPKLDKLEKIVRMLNKK